jgi:hypothetical protein
MNSQHNSLYSALGQIENLISQGFHSFKLYRSEGKVWNVIVNAVQAHTANTLS